MPNAPSAGVEAGCFAEWLRSPCGARLLRAERALLAEPVRRMIGDGLLWLGPTRQLLGTTSQCMVRTRVYADCAPGEGESPVADDANRERCVEVGMLRAAAEALPLAPGSIDGIVLHHALDVAEDRRGALREAARVLRPGGRLLMLGFNPFSLWPLARLWPAFRGVRPVSLPRLHDWLAVLGLECSEKTAYLNYRSVLPLALAGERAQQASRWLNHRQLPVGGVYRVEAVKVGHGLAVDRGRQTAREPQAAALPAPSPTRQALRPAA